MSATENSDNGPVAALWRYLDSWLSADGGVNGPVVHRGDLKRLFAIHDTPWTQSATIAGLLHLHRRSGRAYWLDRALHLAEAQASRLTTDGHFRWAGHEDDRFSSLVHNALADGALLNVAAALGTGAARGERLLRVAETNLERYIVGRLYRPGLRGFVMNPVDYYAGHDRFVVNMNSIAAAALVKLDRLRGTSDHRDLVATVGARILELQAREGPCRGSFPYADSEPDTHVPLYTALTLRGLPALASAGDTAAWTDVARRAGASLDRLRDAETGLWPHKIVAGRTHRMPLFVAGAGMIANGRLDAAEMVGGITGGKTGQMTDPTIDCGELAATLLRHRHANGALRNFIGYDHPENAAARRGRGESCWEDVFPTPNWNAQAFEFLCRVLPPPEPPAAKSGPATVTESSPRYLYRETANTALIVGIRPLAHAIVAFYVKRWRWGLVIPGLRLAARGLFKQVERLKPMLSRRVAGRRGTAP